MKQARHLLSKLHACHAQGLLSQLLDRIDQAISLHVSDSTLVSGSLVPADVVQWSAQMIA